MNLCKCGCGQEIKILSHHKYTGIPKFISGHNTKLRKHTEETKAKISRSHMGIGHSIETRKKLSEINTGRKVSKETKEKMSKIMKGRVLTDEWKRKIGEANKGNVPWHKGLHLSEKTKQKISESQSGENGYNWQGGKLDYWLKELKKTYKECCLCYSKGPLEMHHKDHDRDNNNRLNLIIICRKCHRWWHFN